MLQKASIDPFYTWNRTFVPREFKEIRYLANICDEEFRRKDNNGLLNERSKFN